MGHFPQNEVNYTKQPLSNFQPHFGKSPKQPQAEMKNGVAYKKKMCTPKPLTLITKTTMNHVTYISHEKFRTL